MKKSALLKMSALAAGLLVGAFLLQRNSSTEGAEAALSNNAATLPILQNGLNAISSIKLTGAGNTEIVNLQRITDAASKEQKWVATNIQNYPADVSKIREYLIRLSQSSIREAKTSNPESYAKLGVEDLKTPEAKGILIELGGLAKPTKLLMGATAATGGEGVYVRDPDGKQSFLASGQIRPEASINAWIQADITSIGASRIQQVDITAPNGEVLSVKKAKPEEPDWAVQNPPKGKVLAGPSAGNSVVGTLDALRLESVLPAASGEPVASELYKAQYRTFDGVIIDILAWEANGKNQIRLSARLDEAMATAFASAEAEKAADTAAATALAAQDKKPGAQIDVAKLSAEKLATIKAEVAAINARANGWNYTLPPYQYANIKKTMADMLKSDAPAPGTVENPLNLPIGPG